MDNYPPLSRDLARVSPDSFVQEDIISLQKEMLKLRQEVINWRIQATTPPADAACPHDTNGDGDCGRNTCAKCSPQFQPKMAAAALRALAVPEGYSIVPTLILNRLRRAVDDAEKMAAQGMHLSGAKVAVPISDIQSMLLAASKAGGAG